jgi:hypothetical protein
MSALDKAMQPSVQSELGQRSMLARIRASFGWPWIMMSPPGETPARRAAARSAAFGYEMWIER